MTNSVINNARNLLERANKTTAFNTANRVSSVISELNSLGATKTYINGVVRRLASFNDELQLEEAIGRELYKAQQISLISESDDEEDATGKGSEDATGKGAKFARPVKTKGDAKKSLEDKRKGKGAKLEHLEALFSGEELTDAFKRKASAIFEAAVNARVEEIQAELVRQSRDVFVEEVVSAKGQMANKLDDYMNYVTSEWMADNELAVETGIQHEVTESFMNGLKNLFENHYIEVPKSKVNLVDKLTEKVEKLSGKLNNTLQENVRLSNAKQVSNCDAIFESACHGLADTEIEKFRSLARGIEYNSEAEFSGKLRTLRESYFNSSARGVTTLLNENIDETSGFDGPEIEDLSPRMSAYFNTVGRLSDHLENNTQS
tara:strand:+ start:80 stop:1207 length:1128 start_codon:yes stop_codon:yes gene_type:complete